MVNVRALKRRSYSILTHRNRARLAERMRSARPAPYFAVAPYKAELFSPRTGWSGVMNANKINCLTFADRPGHVITDINTARALAEKWNRA